MDAGAVGTRVEDVTKEMMSMRLASKVRAGAKAREIVTVVDHQDTTQESAPYPQNGSSKGKRLQGEYYSCGEKVHPARDRPKSTEGGK